MEEQTMVSIYVLPTEEGLPPRAIVGVFTPEGIEGPVAIWSRDMGTWTLEGNPVPSDLAEAISAHAKSLEVPGF